MTSLYNLNKTATVLQNFCLSPGEYVFFDGANTFPEGCLEVGFTIYFHQSYQSHKIYKWSTGCSLNGAQVGQVALTLMQFVFILRCQGVSIVFSIVQLSLTLSTTFENVVSEQLHICKLVGQLTTCVYNYFLSEFPSLPLGS